jgi:hypothetical protein
MHMPMILPMSYDSLSNIFGAICVSVLSMSGPLELILCEGIHRSKSGGSYRSNAPHGAPWGRQQYGDRLGCLFSKSLCFLPKRTPYFC